MTAPFQQPDYTSQVASEYKGAIDHSIAVMARIAAAFACRAQTSPNMTVHLEAGALFNGITLTEVAGQNSSTITAPVTHPRIDRIVIDQATGAVSIVAGTENASPTAPAIPAGKLPVARIALTTSLTTIVIAVITDERINYSNKLGVTVSNKSANYTVTVNDRGYLIACDATGGSFTLSLPSAATAGNGFEITAKKIDSTVDTITLDANSSETIDGQLTFVIRKRYESVTIVSDGSNWHVKNIGPRRIINTQFFSANGTYTPTPGAVTADVELYGPGGPGGGGAGSSTPGSAGTNSSAATFTGFSKTLSAGGGEAGGGGIITGPGKNGDPGANGTASGGTHNLDGSGPPGGAGGAQWSASSGYGDGGQGGNGAICICTNIDLTGGGTAAIVIPSPGAIGAAGTGNSPTAGKLGGKAWCKITEYSA